MLRSTKHFLIAAVAVVVGADVSVAQSAAPIFGIHAGLSYSTVSGKDVMNASSRAGFAVGGYMEKKLNDMWSFQPEIQYIQKGVSLSETESGTTFTADLKLNYIEIPVLLRVNGSKTSSGVVPFLQFGPAVSFKAGCSVDGKASGVSVNISCEDFGSDIKSVDFGAMGGVGADMSIGGHVFSATVRYNLGLQDIASDGEGKNRSLTALVGIRF